MVWRWAKLILLSLASLWFVLLPVALIIGTLQDPAWRNGRIPEAAYRWHAALGERIGPWADQRNGSERAAQLSINDISGTEWPMFSAVFYLWASEALQEQWQQGPRTGPSPAENQAASIAALARLIVDPAQADWVRRHWGDGYLHDQNLFYRMLLIAGLDSYERLSGDLQFQALLRTQAADLALELDQSPFGAVDDYPGQSYTVDILMAYAVIARAQRRLGDHDPAWALRAQRAFSAGYTDPLQRLPAYAIDAKSGLRRGPARGVGLSMMLCHAEQLWPGLAREWYARYVDRFWQERLGLAGFRELAGDDPDSADWTIEVDAGPVVAGFGTAANAFGVGAARRQGDLDRAYPLSALALLLSWPLADGSLLTPRLLSNLVDAPHTGEAAVLYAFTRTPAQPAAAAQSAVSIWVWLVLAAATLLGSWWPLRLLQQLRTRSAT